MGLESPQAITHWWFCCSQVYVGLTEGLWERHCRRDFRNAQLEEYESWREMHLRLSEERERKLQQLTKTIVSAHSGKPKGVLLTRAEIWAEFVDVIKKSTIKN